LLEGMATSYARKLTKQERRELEEGLRSPVAFTVRRCQILLMSADDRLNPQQIADRLRCSDQTVRRTIHAFHEVGLACLKPGSRARKDDQRAMDDQGRARLKEIIRMSPRSLGYETSLWTLELLAEVSFKEGLTSWQVSADTIRRTLREIGVNWQRAKQHINSPDPSYAVKKSDVIG
jgi:transposase